MPNTLAQTVMIERGILVFEEGVPKIMAVPAEAPQKAQSLTETMFYEELAKKDPAIRSRSAASKSTPEVAFVMVMSSI